ncbi:hypothetical protein-signal peptide prediction [Rhodopirellula baltica SH 1]|uniref:Uncharacterized protein n=1 Tax=Rhodopirellula baltica (strain DSM 10527 / NCIMB 13988 / SH1) TaxID=243090 RepID=Q7UT43_RHOBA|nr:hypothetical protein-signal peptide prediction [Rhodopirellula baltica SH 1]
MRFFCSTALSLNASTPRRIWQDVFDIPCNAVVTRRIAVAHTAEPFICPSREKPRR